MASGQAESFSKGKEMVDMPKECFINDNFLLRSDAAVRLYHEYAERMPIFDFHCHLNPREIYEDKKYADLTEVWLAEDHYKWRLMRANGAEEEYVTGNADNYEKFLKWADTISKAVGNPLYHWTHMELKRYFGVDELLSPKTAPMIWETCKNRLSELSARKLIQMSNVKAICTTDDPADDLKYHIELSKDESFGVRVLPTFRPERALAVGEPGFAEYISRLSEASGIIIESFEDIASALLLRAEFFKSAGCILSDHSFGSPDFTRISAKDARSAFSKAMKGEKPTREEINAYQTELMIDLGRIYNDLGFAMQLHMGVIRNINSRMLEAVGKDAGFDTIGTGISAESLAALMDSLEKTEELPKTIVYCLDGNDYYKIASIIGSFQKSPVKGKHQLGPAWWYNDHYDGIERHLKALGNTGLLGTFIGMLTDSRSFLSYTRHEYFRRILCNLVGDWMQSGFAPMDYELLGGMIEDICYNNAIRYFEINI